MKPLKTTRQEAAYSQYVLDQLEGEKPANIDGDCISFTDSDGLAEFLDLIEEEASYDVSCGVRTVGAKLALKLRRKHYET